MGKTKDKEISEIIGNSDVERIIIEILSGNKSLVSELFSLYENQARFIARRFLGNDESRIEDVIQEAMMKAYMNLCSLRDKGKFGNWYLKIVRNISIDLAKDQKIFVNHREEDDGRDFESWLAFHNEDLTTVPERFFISDILEKVQEELNELDSDYKEPIRMRYIEELSYNEIAHILHKPLGTIKSLIHRGKAILKERLGSRLNLAHN